MIQESASKLLGRAEDLAETLYGRMVSARATSRRRLVLLRFTSSCVANEQDKNSDKLVSRDEFLELYSQESSDVSLCSLHLLLWSTPCVTMPVPAVQLLTCNEEIIQSILFGVENAAEDISEEADGVPASPVRSLRQNT